jgi:arabinan endo-1,5-alpha-L-arabinosidase
MAGRDAPAEDGGTPRDAGPDGAAPQDAAADAAPTPDAGGDDDRCSAAVLDPGDPPETLATTGDLGTHDPALIEHEGVFYLWQTGRGLPGKTSTDLTRWSGAPAAFASNPAWIAQRVPGATDLWAPDVSFFGGRYHLYYSASTFGSNRSCIGHATREAIDSGSWSDQGPVVCSMTSDDWNAIDPNAIVDADGTAWLAFGSFWSGIKMVRLDAEGATAVRSLASRPSSAGNAIEAPFLFRHGNFYYLFVSFDRCCNGASSTYNQRVGRSREVLGPYMDKAGTGLMQGGGTLLVGGEGRWHGPGHNAVIFSGDGAYNVFHAYDGDNGGRSVLRVAELAWDADGWPTSAGP